MSKYTPGPWTIGGIDGRVVTDSGGWWIAELQQGLAGERTANAALIAAAPDTLDALIELREWTGSEYQNNGRIDAQADAAIAKAVGIPIAEVEQYIKIRAAIVATRGRITKATP